MSAAAPLPLAALVAFDAPRLALMLLEVQPLLRGVALAGPAGCGKSALIEGAHELAPERQWLKLPLGVDVEALLGGIDLEATLRRGERVLQPGLLARAHGGALVVEELNLLPDSTANALLAALDEGEVRIERDGVSERAPARFRLLAAFDPAEGSPRAHLLDRIGLIVAMPLLGDAAARTQIVRRHFLERGSDWSDEQQLLRGMLASARNLLPSVRIDESAQAQLIAAASAFGVQGHRADWFATLAACASAALSLRERVEREDLELAVRLVLMPRATQRPPPSADEQTPPAPQAHEQQPSGAPPPPREDGAPEDVTTPGEQGELAEQVFEATPVELAGMLDSLPFTTQRRARAGSRGSTEGRRGRHVMSVPGDLRRERIDVIATLRVAARWQRLRARRARRIEVRTEDVRVKRYRAKAGALFLFAVDASGSMALNRIRQAKGAVHALLAQAYVNRDRVALMSFRGQGAELLLPPTSSVERLRRAVDQLPTGGGTPLGATLLGALDVAQRAQRRGLAQTVLVLLTDGRANVGVRAARSEVETELQQIAAGVARAGVRCLVVDTQRSYLSAGSAGKLARWLGGQYVYLPGATGASIAVAARQAFRGEG